MKVAGVIAEYNPFHNGHKYQLTELKKQTGADYIIIAMSGDFLQRGVPAIVDKYARAQMALCGGADLVLELPALWATASAEYFASAGVSLLAETGVVDTIGYGAETTNAKLMDAIVEQLLHAPESFDQEMLLFQKEGLSYPAARMAAVSSLLPGFEGAQVEAFLSSPNNILAIEYEKAMAKWNAKTGGALYGTPILRRGDGYHEESIHSTTASATALRNLLFGRTKTDAPSRAFADYVPDDTARILSDAQENRCLLCEDDFSASLYTALLAHCKEGYEAFADCSHDLSQKIQKLLPQYTGFLSFCQLLKSKDITYTRISRVLLHILLGITKENYRIGVGHSCVAYLRVLGFRQDSTGLLTEIKRRASLPLITKMADAHDRIPVDAHPLLDLDIYAADLYRGIRSIYCGHPLPNEFTQEIVRV